MSVIPNSETRQYVIVGVTRLGTTKEVLVTDTGEIILGDEFYIIDESENIISGSSTPNNDVADELIIWEG